MGTPAAAVPTLDALIESRHEIVAVYTQPDKPAGRGKQMRESDVKRAGVSRGLEVYQPLRLKTPETLEEFRSNAAEIAVVVAYGRILPENYLTAFPYGALNLHFSLLPKYRGAAPVNWAIVNGEKETGITVMRMDAGLDTGDILLQTKTEIGDDENSVDLMARLSVEGAASVVEVMSAIDSIEAQPQDHDRATYAPMMTKVDGEIDWTMPAKEISDRVRGFQPFPSAFTIFRGGRVTIWSARVGESGKDAPPGTIVSVSPDEIVVECGTSSLCIKELQSEGKRRMGSRDFINGAKPQVGERLG